MPGQLLSENMFAVDRLQLPVVRAALGSACELYPGFDDWLRNKVGDGLLDGSRRVVIYRDKTRVAGIAIAKRTVDERKLCTLWVDRTARRRKIASALASVVFQWLGTDRPLFTVPEERLVEFQGLLKDWRFESYRKVRGLYRTEKCEYIFNGEPPPLISREYFNHRFSEVPGVQRGNFFELRA